MRNTSIVLVIVLSAAVGGCAQPGLAGQHPPDSAEAAGTHAAAGAQPSRQPRSAETAATQPAGAQVMALVNGRAIPLDRLHEILVHGYGLPVAQQIIPTEVVKQTAASKGLAVTDEDLRAEHDRTLRLTFPAAGSDEERERMLGQLLRSRNITKKTWELVMHRNALLRKLVGADFQVPPGEVRTEFGRRHGRKVVVRHIESKSLAGAKLVKTIAAKGDFIALARQYSVNPTGQNGGLLPPIGKDTRQVSPALRQVALAMTRVGEVSDPVQVGSRFHILKLDRIIEPKDVEFEEVKDAIAADLRERMVRTAANLLLVGLMQSAVVEFVDPSLKAQADRADEQREGQNP
ncbi:MAG: peptidyl-prolyl cis-trans isomerase [Phycisphaerae bacterium]|jgi:parvulin-like peptidyl-prolyl isomerase|nr:peptidyl-prolyl cis-trans isomerase [Phycisphaerae bacterium]